MSKKRGLLKVLEESNQIWATQQHEKKDAEVRRQHSQLVSEIREEVVKRLKQMSDFNRSDAEAEYQIKEVIQAVISARRDSISPAQEEMIIAQVINEILGLGPLEPLLRNPNITEIMVNNYRTVFVEQDGKIQAVDIEFDNDEHVRHVIERILSPLGRRIDESSPMVDARLPDGSRVNAVIPPLAIDGPTITIRKFPERRLTGEDLIRFGSATEKMLLFLEACIKGKKNIVISGGTGSGKTTLLNLLSNYIPLTERIITIEDAAELRLYHQNKGNLVRLESKPPNIQGKGEITIRDLVRNALRMRPDRIIVGECRGGEALDMLQAMNTGHEGSLTTIHANNPREAITRLEMMVTMGAGDSIPYSVIRRNIADAIHLIIQQSRLQDGSRKIVSVTEVVGYDEESGRIKLQEIFKFEQQGIDDHGKVVGRFVSTGKMPTFLNELRTKGIEVDPSIFQGGEI